MNYNCEMMHKMLINVELIYTAPPQFVYKTITWWNMIGSHVMTYFCHEQKLSLCLSINKFVLSVYVFVWNQRMTLPWVCGSPAVHSSDLCAETRTVESSWGLEKHHNREEDRVTLFYLYKNCFQNHSKLKNPNCFVIVFMSGFTFKSLL